MKKLCLKSTKEVQGLLAHVANTVLSKGNRLLSEDELNKSNFLLRVSKHAIQNFGILLIGAKMRKISKKQLRKLPAIEME